MGCIDVSGMVGDSIITDMFHRSLRNIKFIMVVRYLAGYLLVTLLKSYLCLYPIRAVFLRAAGSRIGKSSRIYDMSFFNFYKEGFKNFTAGDNLFVGSETMIDLADEVIIGSNVTIAERVTILTHMNVGYGDHLLKKFYPDKYAPVKIGDSVFIGAGAIIMPGVTIEGRSVIGAMSLVVDRVESGTVVAGIPARVIDRLPESD